MHRVCGGRDDCCGASAAASADRQPLRHLSRRDVLLRLRPASGLGLRGHAAVHSGGDLAVHHAVRAFPVCHPPHPGNRGLRGHRTHRVSGVPVWRTALRNGAVSFGHGGFCRVRDQRPPARNQRLRGAVLDGLRVHRHPHHPDRQSEALAVVWRAGRHRPAEQVFDGRVRAGYRRRITAHAGAQGFCAQVDLDCWRAGGSDLPAEPAVECPSRLAVRAVDAQHPTPAAATLP